MSGWNSIIPGQKQCVLSSAASQEDFPGLQLLPQHIFRSPRIFIVLVPKLAVGPHAPGVGLSAGLLHCEGDGSSSSDVDYGFSLQGRDDGRSLRVLLVIFSWEKKEKYFKKGTTTRDSAKAENSDTAQKKSVEMNLPRPSRPYSTLPKA